MIIPMIVLTIVGTDRHGEGTDMRALIWEARPKRSSGPREIGLKMKRLYVEKPSLVGSPQPVEAVISLPLTTFNILRLHPKH